MKLNSMTAADFVSLKLTPRGKIIEPFLPERGLAEIYARTGVGKTTFALTLATGVALGEDFKTWRINRPWNVLYIDGEMSTNEMQERVDAAAQYFGKDPNQIKTLRLLCHDQQERGLPDIGDEDGQLWFQPDIDWADLIFLDNISCLWWTGRENDADSWSIIQHWLLKLRASGKTIVMLHHSGKNGSSRGTSRRHDVLDTVIKLERPFNYTQQEGAKFEVHFEKARGFAGDDAEPIGLSHTIEDGISCWDQFLIGLEKAQEVADLLKQGMTQIEVAKQLNISQAEVSRRRALAAANKLI